MNEQWIVFHHRYSSTTGSINRKNVPPWVGVGYVQTLYR